MLCYLLPAYLINYFLFTMSASFVHRKKRL